MTTSSLLSQSLVIPVKSSYKPKTGLPYSSSSFSIRRDGTLFLGEKTSSIRRVRKNDKVQRNFAVLRAIQAGVPPPSEPPFQLLNWVVGVVVTLVLPFFTHRWGSLLKIRSEVETVVETMEKIAEVVEKVAEGVENAAEDIADHLPEGGTLRKAVDFVENVAETVSKDAQLVEDLIHKVHEAEEKVEECVESLVEEAREHIAHENHEQANDDACTKDIQNNFNHRHRRNQRRDRLHWVSQDSWSGFGGRLMAFYFAWHKMKFGVKAIVNGGLQIHACMG